MGGFVVTEAAFGELAGAIGWDAAGDQLLRPHLEMERELGIDVGSWLEAEHVSEARPSRHARLAS
jgi:hypothetical protein